jgi:hypothetical protein
VPPLAGALIWLAAWAARWRSPLPRDPDRAIAALLVGIVGYYVYETFFQKEIAWGIASWHFAFCTLLLAMLLGLAGSRLRARLALTLGVILLALGATDLARKLGPGSPTDTSLAALSAAGAWIAENTEPSEVVAATDPGWSGG